MERKKNKSAVSANYLEFIPIPAQGLKYEIQEGKVVIFHENKGAFHWIAQKFFHKPRVSQIHLDEMGNFIWPLMDGERDIAAIALLIKEQFGEKAEPLYNRVVQYFKTLVEYGFVEYNNDVK